MNWTADRIKHLRKDSYRETQGEFCQRLGVVVGSLRAWEQGQGVPSGSAQLLLDRLQEDYEKNDIRPLPGILQEA